MMQTSDNLNSARLLNTLIEPDNSDSLLLDMASQAEDEQPEFVQRYAEKKFLGMTAISSELNQELNDATFDLIVANTELNQ